MFDPGPSIGFFLLSGNEGTGGLWEGTGVFSGEVNGELVACLVFDRTFDAISKASKKARFKLINFFCGESASRFLPLQVCNFFDDVEAFAVRGSDEVAFEFWNGSRFVDDAGDANQKG